MSRPWILGIVSCLLLASSASLGRSQEYLDLPEDVPQGGMTASLAEKLVSLKDKFRRDSSSESSPAANNTSRTNPRHPRYRTSSTSRTTPQGSERTAGNRQVRPLPKRESSRSVGATLAPVTKMFTRSDDQRGSSRSETQFSPAAGSPASRPGAIASRPASKPAAPLVARRSPQASRTNELDAALADLLHTKKVGQSQPVEIEPSVTATQQPEVQPPVTSSGTVVSAGPTFDLRQALLSEDSATRATAAAQSKPTPAAAPVAVSPRIEPVVVAKTPPVVVAKPGPLAGLPAAEDPFESSAQQLFQSAPHQSSNSMRGFASADAQNQRSWNSGVSGGSSDDNVLQTTQQPVIVSHVEGPRSILVGRESTYQVTLENTSSATAENLATEISVPEWAELVDAMSTSGVVERGSAGTKGGVLQWKLSALAPRTSQALRLRLIPRSGRPLQIGVRWSQSPIQSQAVIEVQEPKLELAISGPQEVLFGKPQRYRLTLRNPGTGMTEQVVLKLVPPGGTLAEAVTQTIGNLKAGEVKDIDLELTAREAGELNIEANAIAAGGLKAETIKRVLCRKPELLVDWRGPDKKYSGTVAAYYFRVQNPGTAPTEPVEMSVQLPAGAELVSASEGYSLDATTGRVQWRLASIEASEEQFMQLRCKIARAGQNDFQVVAKTVAGDLSDSKDFATHVIALADLKLEVSDPQGPLPMGDSVVYEIRVRNRGTTSAENVHVVGLFSEGIDPVTVEGAEYSVRDGRVSFHPIKSLPAGREVQLRIHAKASQVGTHIFRTEVSCPELDIKLAAEETTRFFQEEHRWEEGQTPYTAERQSTTTR